MFVKNKNKYYYKHCTRTCTAYFYALPDIIVEITFMVAFRINLWYNTCTLLLTGTYFRYPHVCEHFQSTRLWVIGDRRGVKRAGETKRRTFGPHKKGQIVKGNIHNSCKKERGIQKKERTIETTNND